MNRTHNSILNIITKIFDSIVGIIISFFNRIVFLYFLNATYLGVSGLFSNILLIFSLVELGMGGALMQMFYKPFAEKDYKHLSQVTYTTKILLNIVGIVILLLTLIFTPFLQLFVNDINAVPHMRVIFLLYGISSGITYFLGYYRTIITANQQAYKLVKIDNIWKIITFLLKTIVLAITKNFICYLAMDIILGFSLNIIVRWYVQREISQIDYDQKEFVPKNEQKTLLKNVVGVSLNKIANVVTNGTDNIVISKFLNLTIVGLASNYVMIEQAMNGLIESIFTSLTASIGNLCVDKNEENQYRHYNNLSFLSFWIYGFGSMALFLLSEDLIKVIFGTNYTIPRKASFFICFDLFCIGTFRVATLFRTAKGLFWYGKFRPLLQAIVNLVLSIILVSFTNELWAVYAGTVMSRILITIWYEPLIVFKYGFRKKPWKYYIRVITYFFTYFLAVGITNYLIMILPYEGIIGLIIDTIICGVIPNIIIMILYFRTREFKYWFDFVKKLFYKYLIKTK